jgi:predicted PurR-regulated permease PerM
MKNPPVSDAADRALHSWGKLAAALKGVSPAGYLRFGLVLAAFAGIAWIAWLARAALLPFIVGVIVAYILLPLVNSLDRLMPRFLAVTLALLLFLGSLVLLFYILIPPLVRQAPNFLQLLPNRTDIQEIIARLRQVFQTLPGPTQEAVLKVLETVTLTLREYVDRNLAGLTAAVVLFLVTIFNSIGFVLGFLVVPAWLLSVLKDQREGVRALNRRLPDSIEQDFWAVIRMIDRPLRAFVSGQLLLAIITGISVYLGLTFLEMIGWPVIVYKVPLAVWAASFELIPQIGPYLGALPAVLGGFSISPQSGLGVIALYIVLHYLINRFAGSRLENRIIHHAHPAVLLVVLVALSQFGFLWILVASPVVAILSDLFRYLYGRLSDPPAPAGVLPGQPVPQAPKVQEAPAARIPLPYRRRGEARRSSERI